MLLFNSLRLFCISNHTFQHSWFVWFGFVFFFFKKIQLKNGTFSQWKQRVVWGSICRFVSDIQRAYWPSSFNPASKSGWAVLKQKYLPDFRKLQSQGLISLCSFVSLNPLILSNYKCLRIFSQKSSMDSSCLFSQELFITVFNQQFTWIWLIWAEESCYSFMLQVFSKIRHASGLTKVNVF